VFGQYASAHSLIYLLALVLADLTPHARSRSHLHLRTTTAHFVSGKFLMEVRLSAHVPLPFRFTVLTAF
jgi:hypothetical protein